MIINDIERLIFSLSNDYNNPKYFEKDPIIFPKYFSEKFSSNKATLQDVEICGLLTANLAWGRREMIVRDCKIMLDEMSWRPYEYIMKGIYKDDNKSLHRTIKWCDFARICSNLREYYSTNSSLETLSAAEIRRSILGQSYNPKAANKKVHMFLRWLVRNDGIVDLGVWKNIKPCDLVIPLDVHVHRNALEMGITTRKSADIITAMEITNFLKKVFPDDPCKGDFALFAYSAAKNQKIG